MEYHGKSGVVKIGTEAVGQITNFTVRKTWPVTTRRSMGKTSAASRQGIYEWSGSITCLYDPADAGQTALDAETALAFEGFPIGEASGQPKLSGNIVVAELGPAVPVDDLIEQEFTFNGDGDLTVGTVAP